ncbi:response regulator [Spirosoma soli]|uniref:Response regulator n=1 Tax=Spirosoma soli TaxID=1770529 RepID=A0ABW5MAV8_9BACT
MNSLLQPYIFLVDDDEDDHFLVQQVFNQYNPRCRFTSFLNGAELLRALDEAIQLPTLILLDLNMPNMSGFEALHLLRQQSRYDAVPIVILTTSDLDSDRQQAAALKANGFFTKPSSLEQMNQIVLQLQRDWLRDKQRAHS